MEIIPLLVVCMLATACLLYVDCRYVGDLIIRDPFLAMLEEDFDGTAMAVIFMLAVLFPLGLIVVIRDFSYYLYLQWKE